MAQYQYQGIDRAGKKVNGKVDVANEGELRMTLRAQGVRPIKITKMGAMNQDLGSFFKGGTNISLPSEVMVSTTRQLHVLISSGVPLIQALEVLGDQASSKSLKTILTVISQKVSQGSYFWEGLALYPRVFPKIYIALVKAGEASGSMDQMLKRLTRYMEDANRLKKMIKSAMIYPVITIIIAIGVIALMLIFVIPKFEDMLKQGGETLPGPTQFVIDMSHFVLGNIIYLVVGMGTAGFLMARYARSPEGSAVIDRILFKAPIFGPLLQKAGMARFSRTMQTLLSSGINLIDAIDICKATVGNAVLEEAVGKIRSSVEAGKTLGTVVAGLGVFPKMAVQMISVGEATGNLDKMLEKIADFYEEEVEIFVAGIGKLIEPFILVFLGGIVGGLLIAMYLPIFKMAAGGGSD